MMKHKSIDISLFDLKDNCGYAVTETRKKHWAVMLDLSDQFIRICNKYDIKYFAGGGTLLGAVRHSGFIPWDDDMDFFLPYRDFLKFCEVAFSELAYPYSFQRNLTLARIRNSDTTGCTVHEMKYATPKDNLGIFIDIFPLYKIPDSVLERKIYIALTCTLQAAIRGKNRIDYLHYKNIIRFRNYLEPKELLYFFCSLWCKNLENTYFKLCGMLEDRNTKELGVMPFLTYDNRAIWKCELFEKQVEHRFENRIFKIPEKYDEILKKCFGNYHIFDITGSRHSLAIVDPDTPYTEYVLI